jgi:hypothetical protein
MAPVARTVMEPSTFLCPPPKLDPDSSVLASSRPALPSFVAFSEFHFHYLLRKSFRLFRCLNHRENQEERVWTFPVKKNRMISIIDNFGGLSPRRPSGKFLDFG